jgi:hypothetical protein
MILGCYTRLHPAENKISKVSEMECSAWFPAVAYVPSGNKFYHGKRYNCFTRILDTDFPD